MIKTQLLKFFAELKPEKQLTLVLVAAVMALFAWVKILTGNVVSDKKEALITAEKKCETTTILLNAKVSRLEWKYDSLIAKAVYDKEKENEILRNILNRSKKIEEKIKSER